MKFVIGRTLTILSWDNPVTAFFRKSRKLRHSLGRPSRSDFVHFEFAEVLFMKIEYRKADITDAKLLIDIYNSAFYSDYIKYGECPAYGQTKEMMEKSIINFPKFIILFNNKPVGCVSCKEVEVGVYEVGCLCVVPEFQGKGIGTQAIKFITSHYENWDKFTLVTPIDKKENVKFYTEKCGFDIVSMEMDGNVKVARFVLEK